MKDALEVLSFWLADAAVAVWWMLRAFVVVLAISVGIIAAFGGMGWILRTLAGIL